VVPLYLRAEGTNFPQLTRVIVATGDKVVMEPTLDEAIAALFGATPGTQPPAGSQQTVQSKSESEQIQNQLAQAKKAIDSLEQLLKVQAAKAAGK
jgi:uncharacterized membrane protein (UPF0182 family)